MFETESKHCLSNMCLVVCNDIHTKVFGKCVCGVDHVAALQMSAIGMVPKKAICAPVFLVECSFDGTGNVLLDATCLDTFNYPPSNTCFRHYVTISGDGERYKQ